MHTIYLLIIAGDVIDNNSLFFKITVGNTAINHAHLKALQALAALHNWYLAKYDHNTSDYLLKIALSLDCMPDELNIRHYSVDAFMRHWRAFSFGDGNQQKSSKKVSGKQKTSRPQRSTGIKTVLQHAESVRRIKPKLMLKEFNIYLSLSL